MDTMRYDMIQDLANALFGISIGQLWSGDAEDARETIGRVLRTGNRFHKTKKAKTNVYEEMILNCALSDFMKHLF